MPCGIYDRSNLPKIPAEERFLKLVEKTSSCWIWRGSKQRYGYFNGSNNKTITAHRFSYTQYKGEIPIGLCVCHTCDNPLCVNPEHLFLGTQNDNVQDMMNKGRENLSGLRRKRT